ncbi:MAG TPA: hypothetical protein VH109_00265 [Steroidobacteraceae bacterium]|jgi:hypothetical protein|nr:hypothetical protein [Steroidobacteraceae bacterium]
MEHLTSLSLWAPILLSAVIVFVVSSVIHMAPLWHRNDFPPMPKETEALDALRPLEIPPGSYFIPRANSMKDMKTPEFQQRMARGPVLMLTVIRNGPVNMTAPLTLWFLFLVLVAYLTALVAAHTLYFGDGYRHVFHVVGLVSFMGYSLALAQTSIWLARPWVVTLKGLLDGVIYAALTAGTFAWLWPR